MSCVQPFATRNVTSCCSKSTESVAVPFAYAMGFSSGEPDRKEIRHGGSESVLHDQVRDASNGDGVLDALRKSGERLHALELSVDVRRAVRQHDRDERIAAVQVRSPIPICRRAPSVRPDSPAGRVAVARRESAPSSREKTKAKHGVGIESEVRGLAERESGHLDSRVTPPPTGARRHWLGSPRPRHAAAYDE